jgi:hypothetical protein
MINTRVGSNLSSNTNFIDKINQIVNIEQRASCGKSNINSSLSISKNSSAGSDENTSSASSSLNDLTELDNLLDELYTAKVTLTNKDSSQASPSNRPSSNGNHVHNKQQQQLTANVSYDSATSPSSSSPLSTSSSFSVNSATNNHNILRYPNLDSNNYAQHVSNSRMSVEKMLQLVDQKTSPISSEK